MNLKETIELVGVQAVKASGVKIHTRPQQAADTFYAEFPADAGIGPRLELMKMPPHARALIARTVGGLREQVRYLAEGAQGVTVFVGRDRITAVLDERTERRDRAVMILNRSEPMAALEAWGERLKGLDQKEFVETLRTLFNKRTAPETLLADVRQLKFKSATEGGGVVQTGRESMGRSIEAEVVGLSGDFPDEVTLRCPVYVNVPGLVLEEARITCALDIDVGKAQFSLRPLPGELEKAFADANTWLAEEMRREAPENLVVLASSDC